MLGAFTQPSAFPFTQPAAVSKVFSVGVWVWVWVCDLLIFLHSTSCLPLANMLGHHTA